MEIERKYIIKEIPLDLEAYQSMKLEQGYLSVKPVIRIRKADERYILTVKSKGLMERQEYELDLSEEEYASLMNKVEGNLVSKTRYIIPLTDTNGTCGDKMTDRKLNIELDIFDKNFKGLVYAEVEFPTNEAAEAFTAPDWFYRDVTLDGRFHNSALSRMNIEEIDAFIANI